MSLNKLYNDICIVLADKWHTEHNSAVNLSYFAEIFNTDEDEMKDMLSKNPEMAEILPDLWTRKKYIPS